MEEAYRTVESRPNEPESTEKKRKASGLFPGYKKLFPGNSRSITGGEANRSNNV